MYVHIFCSESELRLRTFISDEVQVISPFTDEGSRRLPKSLDNCDFSG